MKLNTFHSREAASSAVADRIAAELSPILAHDATASIALSGGTSPIRCYEQLAKTHLPWARVHVTLTDERCVARDHADSNERLLRQHLLTGCAEPAKFVAMQDLTFAAPFSVVLVGMGEDGHFASIFPDSCERPAAIDTTQAPTVLQTSTAASPHRRMTLNLTALTYTSALLLLAFGEVKKRHLLQPNSLPVDALLAQKRTPIEVFWAA